MQRDYVAEVLKEEFDGKVRMEEAFEEATRSGSIHVFLLGVFLWFVDFPYSGPLLASGVLLFLIALLFAVVAQKLGKPFYDPLSHEENKRRLDKLVEQKKEMEKLVSRCKLSLQANVADKQA